MFRNFYVPEKEKTHDWACGIVDQFSHYGLNNATFNSEREKMFNNYEFIVGEYRLDQFTYLTDRFGEVTPARMVHYDLLNVKLEKLEGDYLEQPFEFYVNILDQMGIERKLWKEAEVKAELETRKYRSHAESLTGMNFQNDAAMPENGLNPKDEIEVFNTYAIRYLLDRYNIPNEFKLCLKDLAVCKRAFMFVGMVNGDPVAERIDPRTAIFDYDTNKENSDNMGWFARERYLSVSQIISQYRGKINDEQLKAIESLTDDYIGGLLYQFPDQAVYYQQGTDGNYRIRVVDAWWCAERSLEYRVTEKPNEFENPTKHYALLDHDYKTNHPGWYKKMKKNGEIINNEPSDDWWQGSKVGSATHIAVERMTDQPRQERWGWNKSKAPIKYIIPGAVNGRVLSLVDRCANIQLMWDVVMFHVDFLLSRSLGNIISYDEAFKPDGMTTAEVFAFIKNESISIYDSRKEGIRDNSRSGGLNSTNASNMGDIIALFQFLDYLEKVMDNVTGLNRAWSGNMKASDGAHNTANSVSQSDTIMGPLYNSLNMLCEDVLNGMANLIKYAHWEVGERLSYVMDDGIVSHYTVPEDFDLSDCGVKLKVGHLEKAKMDRINQMVDSALQAGAIGFGEALGIFDQETATEAKKAFQSALQVMQKNQAQMQQQQAQASQAVEQTKAQSAAIPLKVQQLKSETEIEVAKIKVNNEQYLKAVDADIQNRLDIRQQKADLVKQQTDVHKQAFSQAHENVMQQMQQENDNIEAEKERQSQAAMQQAEPVSQ